MSDLPAGMIIEEATVEDAAEILALQKLAYQGEATLHDDYDIPPLKQTLAEMEADLDRRLFLKATVEGAITGSVRAHQDGGTCYVGRLIVNPAWQNRGTGTQLMGAIEARFAAAERFELFTGHKSARNLHLYEKLGYQEYRRERLSGQVELVFLEKAGPGSSRQEHSQQANAY